MLEKKVTITRVQVDSEGRDIFVSERIEIFEDGELLGAFGEVQRSIHVEGNTTAWNAEQTPYAQGSLVTDKDGLLYIASTETSVEPGKDETWVIVQELSEAAKIVETMKKATSLITKDKLKAGEYNSSEETTVLSMYPSWRAGDKVDIGDIRIYNGAPYECIQKHAILPSWTPDTTPERWTAIDLSSPVSEWVEPVDKADSYAIGDQVMFEGSLYESLIKDNMLSPSGNPQAWTLIE